VPGFLLDIIDPLMQQQTIGFSCQYNLITSNHLGLFWG